MPDYYTYLISSLPMLHFGMKLPFSFEKFLRICEPLISENDMEILRKIGKIGTDTLFSLEKRVSVPIFEKWRAFDTALRNALVRIRTARKHLDPVKYLRMDGYEDSHISTIAMNAYKNPSILESEEMLDRERWRALDELAIGHYFDIDFLLVYALKLLIVERWERIRAADGPRLLEETVTHLGSV